MNTQAIEQLREKFFKECVSQRHYANRGYENRVNMAPHDLFEWFKKELLPTAQPTEVYVPVSVEDELPEDTKCYHILGRFHISDKIIEDVEQVARYVLNRWSCESKTFTVTHWLKPTKAILIPE